jgi:hypothetical protein
VRGHGGSGGRFLEYAMVYQIGVIESHDGDEPQCVIV